MYVCVCVTLSHGLKEVALGFYVGPTSMSEKCSPKNVRRFFWLMLNTKPFYTQDRQGCEEQMVHGF